MTGWQTVTAWTGALALLAQPVLAQVTVTARNGAPQVQLSSGRLAVFQPRDNEVWIVGEASPRAVKLPDVAGREGVGRINAAWKVEQLQVAGGQGVRITGAVPRRWALAGKPGEWVIAPGHQQALQGSASGKTTDAAGETLTAVARDGTRHQVTLTAGPVDEQSRTMVLAGIFRDPVDADMAAIEAELARIEPAAGDAVMPMHDGTPLQAVNQPKPATEDLAPLNAKAYQPGELIPFTLPEGWGWRNDQPVPLSQLKRGLDQAVASGAVRDAEAAVAAMHEPVPPAPEEPEAETPYHEPVAEMAVPSVAALMTWPEAGENLQAQKALQDALARCQGLAAKPALHGHDDTPAQEDPHHEAALVPLDAIGQLLIRQAMAETAESDHAGRPPLEAAEGHDASEDELVPDVASDSVATDEHAAGEGDGQDAGGHGGGKASATELEPNDPGKLALGWGAAEFTACQSTVPVLQARIRLARQALAEGRPQDAKAQLALLPTIDLDGARAPQPLEGRWLDAVTDVMLMRYQVADRVLAGSDWPTAWQPQVAVWQAAARQGLDASRDAVKLWPTGDDVIGAYPERLRETLQKAVAEAQVAVNRPAQAQAFVDQLAGSYASGASQDDNAVPAWLTRLQGLVRLGGSDEREGLDMLADAANQTADPLTAARAKYDFVKALQRRGELDPGQVISYLNELRLFWRGGRLETEILDDLGDVYLGQGDYRRALDSWQTLVKLDPDSADMNTLTDKMSNALLAAFDPDRGITYTPLAYAGLYYDYKELLPTDNRGDRVTEQVADYLAGMDLPLRSAQLYEQLLLNAQQPAVDSARISLKLAEVYRAANNAAGALQILDKYERMARNSQQQEQWQLEETRALIDLKRYDAAAKAIGGLAKGNDTAEGRKLRADIAWRTKNWPMVTALLGPDVARMRGAALDEDTNIPVAALRMAFASGMQDDAAAIEAMARNLAPVMEKDPTGSDMIAAMAGEAGTSGTLPGANGALGQLATTLRDMNAVADSAVREREEVETQQVEQEDYNNKMKYMELLPPPVI